VLLDLSEGDDEVSADSELVTGVGSEFELLPVVLLDGADAGLELKVLTTVALVELAGELESVRGTDDGLSSMFFDGAAAVVGAVSLPEDDDLTDVAEVPVELGEASVLGVDS
jgi:hypothetical protein